MESLMEICTHPHGLILIGEMRDHETAQTDAAYAADRYQKSGPTAIHAEQLPAILDRRLGNHGVAAH
jgi:type II secretory ATPase GspE/PulE/Tfp pilus assembly ATPase PilB-like protein